MTTKVPSIPYVNEENLTRAVEALKNTADVREGRVGDKLDSNVTYRDLIALDLCKDKSNEVVQSTSTTQQANIPVYTRNTNIVSRYDPTTDLTPPPVATGLKIESTINTMFLSWSVPRYRNHSMAEIWRSQNENVGDAILIGQSVSSMFVDSVTPDLKYYYWIRLVSKANVTGAYTLSPVSKKAEIAPEIIIKAVEGKIDTSHLNVSLANRIQTIEDSSQRILQQDAQSLIAEETSIREINEAGLLSQYTVKIDDNGAVSGFGLASETVDGKTESSFIIRADKFAIVDPTPTATTLTNTPADENIPFAIQDGRTIIKSAVIATATITSAKISDLSTNKLTAGISTSSQFVGGKARFTYLYAGGTVYYTTDPTSGEQTIDTVGNATMFVGDSYARFTADSFIVATSQQVASSGTTSFKPFEVINGTTYIKSAMIQDASIDNAKIGNVIESNNFSSTAGWQINKNGNAIFNNITLTGYAQSSDIPDVSGKVNASGGTLTAGIVRSQDQKMVIDLVNKAITITT